MTNEKAFRYLKNSADSAGCYLREFKSGVYIICWKSFKVGKDGKIGHVIISINPLKMATKELLNSRFSNALSTLTKNEPKAA